jgi:hypothetical protein
MTHDTASPANSILQADLDTTPSGLPTPTQNNYYVTTGQSANIIAQDNNYKNKLDSIQVQDVIYSQWYAQRRANYEITKKYPGTVNPETEYPKEYLDWVSKVLIDELQWTSAGSDENNIPGTSGTIPNLILQVLGQITAEANKYSTKAIYTVRAWADCSNKPSSQHFAQKNTSISNITRGFSYADLDKDNTLTFSNIFFYFTNKTKIQDYLIFQDAISYDLDTYITKVKLPTDRLPGNTHDALVKKYNDSDKNIDSGRI